MNNNLKYVLCAGIFLLCIGIGFLVTRLGKDDVKESVSESTSTSSSVPVKKVQSSSAVIETSSEEKQKVAEIKEQTVPLKIVTKNVKKVGKFYTLQIECSNLPKDVIIAYEIPALKMKSANGLFSKIPGCKSGSYLVNVVNAKTSDILLSESISGFFLLDDVQVDKMTAAQFQALLLNQNDNSLLGGKHPKIAKYVALTFTDLQEGEKRPNDILAVREKIAFGIWSSARVLHVGYDENGRINSARIQPVY
jgi:hypothetical protein